jgi:hypothetical protein
LRSGRLPTSVGGLRGGTARVTGAGVQLVDYEYVPGVRVSGAAPFRATAQLRVSGGGAVPGSVTITQEGRVTGRFAGQEVSAQAGAARGRAVGGGGSDALPSIDRVLALPRLR